MMVMFLVMIRTIYCSLTHRNTTIPLSQVSSIKFKVSTTHTISSGRFIQPHLSPHEWTNGCKLGFDTWADTCCAGKHAHVFSIVEGKTVQAEGFASDLGTLHDLRIANVGYAYDSPFGKTYILRINNAIYLGSKMTDCLANPIQCMESGTMIDLRPKKFFGNDDSAQTVTFSNGLRVPISHYGPLPFLHVRRPSPLELDTCPHIEFTPSDTGWDPHDPIHKVEALSTTFDSDILDYFDDPLANKMFQYDLPFDAQERMHMDFNAHDEIAMDELLDDVFHVNASLTKQTHSIPADKIAKLWHCGLSTANRTLLATTHESIRTTEALHRRFCTDLAHRRYRQLSTYHGDFYVDTLLNDVTSIRGFNCGNLFCNKSGFYLFIPMANQTGGNSTASLNILVNQVGLQRKLHSDNHKTFQEGQFPKRCRYFNIPQSFTEPHSSWQNRAEPGIGIVRRYSKKLLMDTQTPIRLWCFCYEYAADLLSLMVPNRFELQGRTPYEVVAGYTPDISEYVIFSWYQWCYYWDEGSKEKAICRWLGPSKQVGQALCYYIHIHTNEYIARSSVVPIPDADFEKEEVKSQMKAFTDGVEAKIGNYKHPKYNPNKKKEIYYTAFGDDPDADSNTNSFYQDEALLPDDIPLRDNHFLYNDEMDNYIGSQVVIPGTDDALPVLATVKKKKRDANGNLVGTYNVNPILNSNVYQLEFPDGRLEEYSANVIADHLWAQCDEFGHDVRLLDDIVDHRFNADAVPLTQGFYTTNHGPPRPVITTKGVDLLTKLKDGTTHWISLSEMKEAYPIEVAEYAVANNIHKAPAFNWWVPKTLKQRKHLIKKVKRLMKKQHMKYGVMVPSTVEEAKELDRLNGNTLWNDAIKKEMTNNEVSFQILGAGEAAPSGYKKIGCHLVFDVKADFTRKARYVAEGYKSQPPPGMTYAGVVSRESVRIGFLIAALNDLDILSGDVQNAFINAPTPEKVYFIAGNEWKSNKDRVIIIVRALYGLKSSAFAWREYFSDAVQKLGFEPSKADPEVFWKPNSFPDGREYYTYIMVYVDDILIIDKRPMDFMKLLKDKFIVKKESIKEPDRYLGSDVSKIDYCGNKCWSMSSETYVKEAVCNVKAQMKQDGYQFNKKLSDVNYSPQQPFSHDNYRPELDTSAECNEAQMGYYMNLIGVLRWIIELGWMDIAYEVSCLSRYLASPRTGHLVQALHIFKYLELHNTNSLVFDTRKLDLEVSSFSMMSHRTNMRRVYPDAHEDLPPNAPKPRGASVQMNCFVDASHADDRFTRRSQTGIIIYCNMAPISWYSKRQNTVESSTFGSEFVALRIATELVISLRYKLRMFGVPIDGPTNVFCDNEAVYKNVSSSDSQLKKKHNSICYHKVRESVAAGIIFVFKENSETNLADILTKSLNAVRRKFLRSKIMLDTTLDE